MIEMKKVPVEPTQEMKTAAIEIVLFDHDSGKKWELSWEEVTEIYKAMVNSYKGEK